MSDSSGIQPEDTEWAARLRVGDPAAFERLYHIRFEELCDFAMTLLDSHDDARDVVQDVFVRLWQSRESLTLGDHLTRYLFGATRNGALNVLRHRQIRQRHADDEALQAVTPSSPDGGPDDELLTRVLLLIEHLPERSREVMALRWRHQLEFGEIARIMGITVPSAHVLHARALAALRSALRVDVKK